MNIQSSNLLAGTSKSIQVANTCVIAKEGPNMISKLGLGDLNINYDSVFTTRQTLKIGGKDTPIMYGFLGTNITFLLIKPMYGYHNPQGGCSGTTHYLEYYFEDEPLIRRTFTDILVLSGDAEHRIPQVFLYNPTDSIVTLDIMAANLDENEITTTLVPTYSELKGLSFSSIQTDQIFGILPGGICTGSTQFEIKDINGNIQMVIPYNRIDIININNEILTVSTRSDSPVKLYFLSNFNAQQALSRMNWVMEQSITRYATSTYPGLDTTAPVVTYVSNNAVMTYINNIITPAMIRNRFIDNVIDYDNDNIQRDGSINKADVNLLIVNSATGEQVSAVTYDGRYSVTFTAKDLAGNSTSATKILYVDSLPPTIYFNSGITNPMLLTGDTSTPGTIEKSDIRHYFIDYVWDDVDGKIDNSLVNVLITSASTTYTSITGIGYYDLTFSVSDYAGNSAISYKTLHVTENVPPVIHYNNSVFTLSAFTMSLSAATNPGYIYETDIRTYALSSVTDNYDGNININNVNVTGANFPSLPIDYVGGFEITFSVSDSAGNETTGTKWLITTV